MLHYDESTIIVATIGLLAIITFFVYYIYIKKKYIYKLTENYKDRKINKTLLYLVIGLTPLVLLLFAGFITVFLNGGEILGTKIKGFLRYLEI